MEEVVRQQLAMAWIQAAAAVVQAVGAVAAIIFSVKIARDAERRAGDAEQASAQRERHAEANALAREEAAMQAAAARAHQADIQPFNDALDVICIAADRVAIEILQRADEIAAHIGERVHYSASLNSEKATTLRNMLTNAATTSPDPAFVHAIETLKAAVGSADERKTDLPEVCDTWLRERYQYLSEARHELQRFRKT